MNLVLRQSLVDRAEMKSSPDCARLDCLSVASLRRQIQAGDVIAFEEFHRRYAPRVYGFLMSLTYANDALSRDLLQIVMFRAARKFKTVSTDEELWGWLATITRNALVDHVRSEQRRKLREQRADEHLGATAATLSATSDDLASALEQALTELAPEDQALVREFYFRAQPQADIAARCETTVKALQSRLARIRRRLKETLMQKIKDET